MSKNNFDIKNLKNLLIRVDDFTLLFLICSEQKRPAIVLKEKYHEIISLGIINCLLVIGYVEDICRTCLGHNCSIEEKLQFKRGEDVLEEVEEFCFLGDMIRCYGGALRQ